MAWVKLDDRFWSNRKVRKAGDAIGAWILMATWSAEHGTEGRIPVEELDFICTGFDDPNHAAERLEAAGLLISDEQGSECSMTDAVAWRVVSDQSEADRIRKAARRRLRPYLLRRSNGRCVRCGTSRDLQIDHVVPLARSMRDPNRLSNLQILCGRCNRKKATN